MLFVQVKIQFSGASQPESQPRFSIEEVHADEHAQGNGHSPVVEEPEEGNTASADFVVDNKPPHQAS